VWYIQRKTVLTPQTKLFNELGKKKLFVAVFYLGISIKDLDFKFFFNLHNPYTELRPSSLAHLTSCLVYFYFFYRNKIFMRNFGQKI
jgi:hypothetical protein